MTDARRNKIRAFLAERNQTNDIHALRDDEPIFSSGRLDSMSAIELILFLEKEFALNPADPDFDPTRLDSIDEIMDLLPREA